MTLAKTTVHICGDIFYLSNRNRSFHCCCGSANWSNVSENRVNGLVLLHRRGEYACILKICNVNHHATPSCTLPLFVRISVQISCCTRVLCAARTLLLFFIHFFSLLFYSCGKIVHFIWLLCSCSLSWFNKIVFIETWRGIYFWYD